jgi:hypothetical protein
VASTLTVGQTTTGQGNGFLISIVANCTRCSAAHVYPGKLSAQYNGTLLNSTVAFGVNYITRTPIFGNGTTTWNYLIPSSFFLNISSVTYTWTLQTLNATGGTLEVKGYVNAVLVTDQTVTPPSSRQALVRVGPWGFSFSGYTQLKG